ncbi:hypothetical protein ANCCAN_08270, partial [Ancylostoma caninum]
VNKKPPTPPEAASSPQRKESIARSEDIPTPLGITASEPPRSEHSFTSDEIPIEMTEKEAHYEAVESPIAEANWPGEHRRQEVGETAQDVLKRLASNGNLPALQKLVARRTPEPPTIDQVGACCPRRLRLIVTTRRVFIDLGLHLIASEFP